MKSLITALVLALGTTAAQADTMKMAVTTSFNNSGLSDVLLPAIKEDLDLDVQLLIVGTGQALRLGEAGDVDAILGQLQRYTVLVASIRYTLTGPDGHTAVEALFST